MFLKLPFCRRLSAISFYRFTIFFLLDNQTVTMAQVGSGHQRLGSIRFQARYKRRLNQALSNLCFLSFLLIVFCTCFARATSIVFGYFVFFFNLFYILVVLSRLSVAVEVIDWNDLCLKRPKIMLMWTLNRLSQSSNDNTKFKRLVVYANYRRCMKNLQMPRGLFFGNDIWAGAFVLVPGTAAVRRHR